MKSAEAFLVVIEVLERRGIPYMVVGAFASNVYGVPRSTQDADIVINLGDRSVDEIAQSLGPEFKLDSQMSFETITGTSRYVIEHLPTQFEIEFFLLRDDAYHQTRFSRRTQVDHQGRSIWAASAEDMIIMKLRWGITGRRGKDIDDVINILKVQKARGVQTDWSYVHHWCDEHGTRALLDKLRSSLDPT